MKRLNEFGKIIIIWTSIYTFLYLIMFCYLIAINNIQTITLLFFLINYCLILLGVYRIYMILDPVYEKNDRISKLNSKICGLLQQSVYVKDSEEFYHQLLESAIECIEQATKGSIMLMGDNNKLHFAAAIGYDFELLKHTYLELEQTYLYRESKGMVNKTVKIQNPFEYDRNSFDVRNIDEILKAGTDNVMTTLSTPIFFEGKLHGMINIDSPIVNAYDRYDMEIIELFAIEAANVLKLYNSLEMVYYMTNYDILTDIPNRRCVTKKLEQLHRKYLLTGGTYALVSIDLNNLKTTNDRYGHLAGDELLKNFSSVFRKKVPSEGIFGRYGGDEFLLVLPDTEKAAAHLFMDEAKSLFEKVPLLYESESIEISFCYGIAVFGQDGEDLQELFHLSDRLMYEQKKEFHEKKIN